MPFVAVHGFKNSVVDYKYLIFNLSIVCSPLGNPSYYLNFKEDFIVWLYIKMFRVLVQENMVSK